MDSLISIDPLLLDDQIRTLCNKAENTLASLQHKKECLEQQKQGLADALGVVADEIVAARAVISALKLLSGEQPLPNSLPHGLTS